MKDEEVTPEIVRPTQAELNGNVSMLIKFFKLGAEWGQSDRMRETMLNSSLSLCPMYLLYKDHKGWTWEKGPVPPTRPVASGNRGMNIHLSEIISEVLEPVADEMDGKNEVISTEDMVAKLLEVDRSLMNWNEVEWWRGVVYDGFEACLVCRGDEKYVLDTNNPELCVCVNKKGPKDMVRNNRLGDSITTLSMGIDNLKLGHRWENSMPGTGNLSQSPSAGGEMKGMFKNTNLDDTTLSKEMNLGNIDENTTSQGPKGTTKVSVGFMEKLRQRRWSAILSRVPDGWVDSREVDQEMIHDFGKPMEVIGWDVNALYPSLDWETTQGVVKEAIINSKIKWEDIDYMEGCRYIALNLSGEECRSSNLSRILPVRRAKTGVRPGVKGPGPMGAEPHDQEQWRFPEVTLTEEEKKEVITAVVAIATKNLFSNHLYTFANKVYRQKSGGAIGLRATCAIARVTMNIWDQLWNKRMVELNLRKEVYTRYMDDGRALIYPIRPGWRYVDGLVKFHQKWVEEDQLLTPTFRTMRWWREPCRGL